MGWTQPWTKQKVPRTSFILEENINKMSLSQIRKSYVLHGFAQISPPYETLSGAPVAKLNHVFLFFTLEYS